ncbi:hypothetical protein H4217_004043 [Coemansia sp. RSA 1939]|nr:hypothetical protein H4217_004043 [Coemansia sp. RSA 1939]KAJ2609985.1 hypothetical protein EV177_004189 [Coemansia sp. RSA 1804]KAJ2692103.1 hypothetical protein GGH99_001946 [Coemansia sp. RSA 1285]
MTVKSTPTKQEMELELLPFEKFFRAYVGFFWFYKTAPAATAEEMRDALQRGVDATTAATPVLAGVLREERNEDRDRVYVGYNEKSSNDSDGLAGVRVDLGCCTDTSYADISASGFDQNALREQLFVDQTLRLAEMPGIDGVPVLRVMLRWLSDGGCVVGVLCHHVLADAAATFYVAQTIAYHSSSLPSSPDSSRLLPLEPSRKNLSRILAAHPPKPIPAVQQVRSIFGSQSQQPGARNPVLVLDPAVSAEPMRRYQARVTAQSIGQLKGLAIADSQCVSCSSNALVMALMWRAWTRMLQARGSRSPHAYLGWPVDLRRKVEQANTTDPHYYLGNLFLPCLAHASTGFVLTESLPAVAAFVAGVTETASVGQLRAFQDSVAAGEADVRAMLEQTSDAPSLSFSNMTRLGLYDKAMSFATSDIAAADSVQMLAIDAPAMMFAIADGAGGMLVSVVLPGSVADAFAADPEFLQFASFVY